MSAAKYAGLAKTAPSPSAAREFHSLERNFSALAANEEWLTGHTDHTLPPSHKIDHASVQDERALRCLGIAVVMRWKTLPMKIQRDLSDYADSIGKLQPTSDLEGHIGRVLCDHRDNAQKMAARLP
jgi:hypothetical protein